jgi:hypothetical protein
VTSILVLVPEYSTLRNRIGIFFLGRRKKKRKIFSQSNFNEIGKRQIERKVSAQDTQKNFSVNRIASKRLTMLFGLELNGEIRP